MKHMEQINMVNKLFNHAKSIIIPLGILFLSLKCFNGSKVYVCKRQINCVNKAR